jgi:hypothetical protein
MIDGLAPILSIPTIFFNYIGVVDRGVCYLVVDS